jgi:putative peptidoglycan lipid II flippase
MSLSLNKRDILKKTAQTGSMTLISRFLGMIREILLAQFFGVGAMSDAFYAALKFPNFLRHIFAEGAMSAAFVPSFVKSLKEGDKKEASGLMTLSLLFFEGIILIFTIVVVFKTDFFMRLLAPGFSQERLAYAIPFLRILFPFLLLVSSSTLFAGALNAVNIFAIPAFGVVLWNIFFVLGAITALYFIPSSNVICAGVILGGFAWLALNMFLYFKKGFGLGHISPSSIKDFKIVLTKFLPCFFGVGIVELNLFLSGILASYLSVGLPTLLYYGSRFMNIPLGAFAVAFSNVVFAHFSRVVLYAPRRLNFYILEVTKFVSWVIIPVTLFIMFISTHLFTNVMLAKTKDPLLASQGAWILIIYLFGLLFFCLNKSLLTIFYALKDTVSTTIALSCSAIVNICGDLLGIYYFGAYGFAAAASASGMIITLLCFYFLHKKHKFTFYTGNYFNFLARYMIQLAISCVTFISSYFLILWIVKNTYFDHFFNVGLGYWIMVFGLGVAVMLFMFFTRKMFGIRLHFLDK